jgi:hypothetical protein
LLAPARCQHGAASGLDEARHSGRAQRRDDRFSRARVSLFASGLLASVHCQQDAASASDEDHEPSATVLLPTIAIARAVAIQHRSRRRQLLAGRRRVSPPQAPEAAQRDCRVRRRSNHVDRDENLLRSGRQPIVSLPRRPGACETSATVPQRERRPRGVRLPDPRARAAVSRPPAGVGCRPRREPARRRSGRPVWSSGSCARAVRGSLRTPTVAVRSRRAHAP